MFLILTSFFDVILTTAGADDSTRSEISVGSVEAAEALIEIMRINILEVIFLYKFIFTSCYL